MLHTRPVLPYHVLELPAACAGNGGREACKAKSSELSSAQVRPEAPDQAQGPLRPEAGSPTATAGKGMAPPPGTGAPYQLYAEWSPALLRLAPCLRSLGSGRKGPPPCTQPRACGQDQRAPENGLSCPFSFESSRWASWPQPTLGTKPQWGKGAVKPYSQFTHHRKN